MTDDEITHYLRDSGYPDHVWRAGRKGLIGGWRQFVEQCERGYKLGLEDYRNDLDIRSLIAELGLEGEVREVDERFRKLLTARDVRVWNSGAGDVFWDFGYPANASGELLEGLRNENLA